MKSSLQDQKNQWAFAGQMKKKQLKIRMIVFVVVSYLQIWISKILTKTKFFNIKIMDLLNSIVFL